MNFEPSTLNFQPGLLGFFSIVLGLATIIGAIWLFLGLVNVRNWVRGDFRLFITVLLVTASTGTLLVFTNTASQTDLDQGTTNLQAAVQERYGFELSEEGLGRLIGHDRGAYQWDLHKGKGDQQYWTSTEPPVELVIDGERQAMKLAWLGDQWILEDADGEELPIVSENETGTDN